MTSETIPPETTPSEKFKSFVAHIRPIVEKHKDGRHLRAEKLTVKSSRPDCLVCGQQIGSNSCSMQH